MSPGEVAEGIGWGSLVSVALAVAASLLRYGAANQRSKRTAEDLADLKKDHEGEIAKAQTAASQVAIELTAHKLEVLKDFVSKDSLTPSSAGWATRSTA